jgi:hypothetical protein
LLVGLASVSKFSEMQECVQDQKDYQDHSNHSRDTSLAASSNCCANFILKGPVLSKLESVANSNFNRLLKLGFNGSCQKIGTSAASD